MTEKGAEIRVGGGYTRRSVDDHPPFLYTDYRSTVKRSPTRDLVEIVHSLSETTGPGPVLAELNETLQQQSRAQW